MSKKRRKLTPEQAAAAYKAEAEAKQKEGEQIIRDLNQRCSEQVAFFANYFMRDEEELGFQVPTRNAVITDRIPKFQQDIFRELDLLRKTRRIALASPRGYTKSTTCSVIFPLQAALYKIFTEILIVSSSESLAIDFLRKIRTNLESNRRICGLFGKQESEKWTETQLILKCGVSIRGCGVGAQIRGFRPDLILLDDIESDETVQSEELRRKLKEWLFKAAINSLTPNGCMLFLGTLISPLSLLYEFVNNPPEGWKSIFNQAYRDGIEEEGHELWPEVWPHKRLQARKAEIGSVAFSSEFMNKPIPSEGIRFNPSHIKYYEDSDIKDKATGMYITIDPAFSEDTSADYGVILMCLHDAEDNLYVKEYFRERTTARTIIDKFKALYKAYQPKIRGVGIEMIGPQKAFYEQLVEECNRERLYPMFTELKGLVRTGQGTKRKKEDRITYAIQPRLEAGKIFFKAEHQELISELLIFPHGKHDDLIDALAYQFEVIEPYMDYTLESGTSFTFENELEPAHSDMGVTGYGEF